MTKSKYYNWQKTLSYNADVTIVIASRGRGKTYGLRKQCMNDWLRDESTWVEIVRYKSELGPVMDGYYDKLQNEFPGYIFKTQGGKGYIAPEPPDVEEGEKKPRIDWKLCTYFIALTDAQNAKKRTYNKVRRLIFDEAILERRDRFHSYIPSEYQKLANIVDTTTRERADTEGVHPHLYLLGNACDLLNPYFEIYGINKQPKFGYHWYRNKTVIIHYEDPGEYANDKLAGTVSGRMTAGTTEGEIAARNSFVLGGSDLIAKKPRYAKYEFGFVMEGKSLGIWADYKNGYYYITDKVVSDYGIIYYITRDDSSINYLACRRATPAITGLREAHYANIIRYSSPAVMNRFLDMMQIFGL